jgi:hypothetical protein
VWNQQSPKQKLPLAIRASNKTSPGQLERTHCNFAYSASACFKDGDVGVGVFPEGEEVFVRLYGQSVGIETSSSLQWDAIKVPA